MVRATCSLPAPVSPVIRTDAELGAAISTMRITPASVLCRPPNHQGALTLLVAAAAPRVAGNRGPCLERGRAARVGPVLLAAFRCTRKPRLRSRRLRAHRFLFR